MSENKRFQKTLLRLYIHPLRTRATLLLIGLKSRERDLLSRILAKLLKSFEIAKILFRSFEKIAEKTLLGQIVS